MPSKKSPPGYDFSAFRKGAANPLLSTPTLGALSAAAIELQKNPQRATISAGPAPKGTLTGLASKGIEKLSRALGSSERDAIQRAHAFEDASLDWNPLSQADEVGTQLRRAADGSRDFDKGALAHGAVGTALTLGGEALPGVIGALSKTATGKKVIGALSKVDPIVEDTAIDGTAQVVGSSRQPAKRSTPDVRTKDGAVVTPAPVRPHGVLSDEYVQQPLKGQPLKAPGSGPDSVLRDVARRYNEKAGLLYAPPTEYARADPARGAAIAKAFEEMPHDPDNPEVRKAYGALSAETLQQYQALKDAGYSFGFYPEGADPYPSPWDATRDLRDNRHMKVYPTDAGYGSGGVSPEEEAANPLLAPVPGETWDGKPVRVNDVFRGVHDAFGHAKNGVGFRADGEENAWQAHMGMFSPEAQRALTTETRGQNSWLNFGPHGAANRSAKTGETVFADQKIGLLPEWALDPKGLPPRKNAEPGAWSPERIDALRQSYAGKGGTFVAHLSPEEFLGLTASKQGREALHSTASLGEFDPAQYEQAGPVTLEVGFGGQPSEYQRSLGVTQLPSTLFGHDGRHRMAALQRAGAKSVPVLVRARGKHMPTSPDAGYPLSPQTGRLATANNGDTPIVLKGLVPLEDFQP